MNDLHEGREVTNTLGYVTLVELHGRLSQILAYAQCVVKDFFQRFSASLFFPVWFLLRPSIKKKKRVDSSKVKNSSYLYKGKSRSCVNDWKFTGMTYTVGLKPNYSVASLWKPLNYRNLNEVI